MPRSLFPFVAVLALGCARDAIPALPTPTMLSEPGADHRLPVFSPDGSRIVGMTAGGGGVRLWLADGDGGNLTVQEQLLPGFIQPTWSPDGTRVATTRSGGGSYSIVVTPATGGDATPVYTASGLMFPTSWSADGSKLMLLASQAAGIIGAQVVDVATGAVTPLLPDERRTHFAVFAPVGERAVVMINDSARNTLWAVDSLGAAPRQLTSEGFEVMPQGTGFWSPDGTQLVFESARTGAPDLWVLDFATGEARQLTSDLRADRHPFWSPDGQWILFESERGRQTDLWVVPAAGGDAIRLTNDAAIEMAVGWRGQTREVAYTVEGGTGALLSVPVAGGDEVAITPDSVTVDYFAVSPDGSQVAFTSRRTGSVLDIWVMPSGGGPARLLASPPATVPRVFWSPDGAKLAFLGVGGGTPDAWVVDVATGALQQAVDWSSVEYDLLWGRSSDELLVLSDRESRFSDVWRVPLSGGDPVRLTTDGVVNVLHATLDGGTRLLVGALGGASGRLALGEVRPDGTVRTIHDARSVWGVAWDTPAGSDSVAVQVDGDDGQLTSAMMSLTDGGMRPLGPPGAATNFWSGDGTMIAFASDTDRGRAVGVVDLRTGTARMISSGAGRDGGAEFLPGDSVVVFRRNRPESRIAVMDLSRFLPRTP